MKMMFLALVACVQTYALSNASIIVQGAGAYKILDSLDSALAESGFFPQTNITLGPASYSLTYNFSVANELFLIGSGEMIIFNATLSVKNGAVLRMCNFSIEVERSDLPALIDVQGLVQLSAISIFLAEASVFLLAAGQLEMKDCELADNKSALVSVECEGCRLSLTNVVTSRHLNRFVNVPQSPTTRQITIVLSNSVFRNCTGSAWLALFQVFAGASEPLLHLFAAITNTTFEFNDLSIFDFYSLSNSTVQVSNCTFFSNTGKTMLVNTLHSMVSFESCVWDSNSDMIVQVGWLGGLLSLASSQVLNQMVRGLIYHTSASIADCKISLTDVLVSGSINSTYFITGIVLSSNCAVVAKRIQVIDFLPKSHTTKVLRALFDVWFGVLEIEDMSVVRSGTSGYILTIMNSHMRIKNIYFRLPYLGGNAVMGGVGGSMFARNITLSGTLDQEKSLDTDFDGPMFIGWFEMEVDIADMSVDNVTTPGSSGMQYLSLAAAAVGTGGSFQIARVSIQDLNLDQFLVLVTSSGSITDFIFQNCTLRLSVFSLFRDSNVILSRMAVSAIFTSKPLNMNITTFSHNGIFMVGADCNLQVSNFSLSDVRVDMLFIASQANVMIETMTVERSQIGMLVRNSVRSVISLTSVHFSALRTGKILTERSTVSFFNCSFTNVSVTDTLFLVIASSIIFEDVMLFEVYTHSQLGNFAEKSTLTITRCSLRSFGSIEGGGFTIKPEGALSVRNSIFVDFNSTVFQVSGSAVTIVDSHARHGVSTIRSVKSNEAYGAFLGCYDCTWISIREMSAFNLTALRGGAFACRAVAESTEVSIVNSHFTLCSAEDGGAGYFAGCSFSILGSEFAHNRATASGGGVDLTIEDHAVRMLQNCSFTGNSAVEGGAVRWHNANVHLINVSFVRNLADYGPDLASYPVALSSVPSQAAPGYQMQLVFEIVDHYGQRVSTASGKAFRLNDTETVKYLGNQVAYSEGGIISFPELTVFAQPATTQALFGEINEYFDSVKRLLTGSVEVAFRNCTLGEVYRSNMCEYCNSGNVTYSVDDENCQVCPENAHCPGGSNLVVMRRYWRSAWNSTLIHECPFPDKCLGGLNSTCVDKFTGKLCNECVDGAYRVRVTECEHCGPRILLVLQFCAIYGVLLLFAHAVLKYGLDKPDEFKLFVIKCIANHFQLLSAMAPFKVTYPTIVKNTLRAVAYVSSLGVSELPIACFGFAHPEFLRPVIGSLMFPVLVAASAPVLLIRSQHRLKAAVVLASSACLFIPAVAVQTVVLLLACQSIEGDGEWLFIDMSERCWQGTHQLLATNLLIPSVLCNCILPLAAAIAMRFSRPSAFRPLFPMWWAGNRVMLWDIFQCCAKCVCLWLMLNSIPNLKVGQVSYGFISLIVMSVTTVTLYEIVYKARKCFRLVETSAVIVSLSLGLGSYYIYYLPGERFIDYLVVTALLTLNAGYFVMCLWLLRGQGSILIPEEQYLSESQASFYDASIQPPPNSASPQLSLEENNSHIY